ncbi:MAG: hypothetical protein HYR85_26705, partial [Planctomycetes bacterium]|nr:hypothetical protein [Planctomycetota bacterium]
DGVKLADSIVSLAGSRKDWEESATFVSQRVTRRLELASGASGARAFVGVIGFASEEVSRRWDWLSGSLSTGVEERLNDMPGVVLLERERLWTLTDERALTEGLPDRVKTSAVLVDGSFRIGGERGKEEIALALRGRRGKESIFEVRLTAPALDPADLAHRAADEIQARLKLARPPQPMSANEEVAALLREASVFRKFSENERAMRLVEAAHAIAPERVDCLFELLLTGVECYHQRYFALHKPTPDDLARYYRALLPICHRTLAVAEQIVANSLPHTLYIHYTNPTFMWKPHSYVVDGLYVVFGWGSIHLGPASADPEARDEIQGRLRVLFAKYRALVKGKDDVLYATVLAQAAQEFPWLCESPEEAMRFCLTVQEETAGLMRRTNCPEAASGLKCGASIYDFDRATWGKDRAAWKPLYEKFVATLCNHSDPLLRLSGHFARMRLVDRDPNAREQALADLELLRNEVIGSVQFDGSNPWFTPWVHVLIEIAYGREHAPDENALEKAHAYDQLSTALEKQSVFAVGAWRQWANAEAGCYERASRAGEGLAVLDRAIALCERRTSDDSEGRYERGKLADVRRQFLARHPELVPVNADSSRNRFEIERVASFTGLGAIQCRRIVSEGDVLAIVYVRLQPPRVGVLRLDPKTREITRRVEMDRDVVLPSGGPATAMRMPSVAVDGDTIYVGVPGAGIAVFPNDESPRCVSEASGLADARVHALEFVDGKLFALVGDVFTEAGVMEVDPATGKSRMLCSSRARERRSEIDGRIVHALCANPAQHSLVLEMGPVEATIPEPTRGRSTLFVYDLRSGTVERLRDETFDRMNRDLVSENGQVSIRRSGSVALFTSFPFVYSLDLATRRITPLVKSTGAYAQMPLETKWTAGADWPRAEFLLGTGLVCLQRADLLFFREGKAEAEFPLDGLRKPGDHRREIRDIAPTGRSILLLEDDSLHVVHGFE